MTETVLQEAQRIVDGQRKAKYGPPEVNHAATADFFRVWVKRRYGIDVAFDPRDVCMFNILQKCSREAHVHDRDNMVDIPGYCRNVEIVMAAKAPEPQEPVRPNPVSAAIKIGDVVRLRSGVVGRSLDDRDLRVDLVVSDGFGGSVLHVSTAQGHTAVVPPSAVESILSTVLA